MFRLTGVSFCADAVAALEEGTAVRLTPQPENEHDPNAIRVSTLDGTALGWVPAPLAARISSEGDMCPLVGQVIALRSHDGRTVGADIIVTGVVQPAAA